MGDPIRFQLEDWEGKPHDYILTLHLGGEGALLAMRIGSLLADPLVQLMASVVSESGAVSLEALMSMGTEILKKVDARAIGPAVSAALASEVGQRIVRKDLIKYVVRDGHDLSNATHFDKAFQGNYLELTKLVWEVAKSNRFLPSAATSESSS